MPPGCTLPGGPTGCLASKQPTGALWFYEISDPTNPRVLSQWSPPESEHTADFCTSHFFRPFVDDAGRDLLVTAWYEGGVWVVDFTIRLAAAPRPGELKVTPSALGVCCR